MARIGSDSGLVGDNSGGVFDDSGNPIVSTDTDFGASPLGIAARSQALYFLPNPSFNILPPDPAAPIVDNANALPYWSVEDLSEGRIVATTVFDETVQTWALEINPTAGSATDSIAIKTRSYLLNDSNFDLRQKALASLEKVNAYAGTTEWALTLGAEYFSAAGSSLSSYSIGTVADNATWTSLSGFTTSGTAIVDAAAQYVDLTFTLTTTAAVTSTVKVHINSILLQTSTAGGGGGSQSFLIVDAFTSSGTWTRPTGVDYVVAVAGYSAGNGGAGGRGKITRSGDSGGGLSGGQPGAYGLLRDLYVGDVATVSVGIGAGGVGGAGGTATKAVSVTTATITGAGAAGGVGGNTTFGSYLVCATTASDDVGAQSGTVTTTLPFPDKIVTSTARTTTATTDVSNSTLTTSGFTSLPFQESFALAGTNGANGTADGATVGGKTPSRGGVRTLGGTAGQAGIGLCMGGVNSDVRIDAAGGYAYSGSVSNPSGTATYYGGSAVHTAGGGGGAGVFWISTTAGTGISAAGGNGGNASANSGSGGGGGGQAIWGNSGTGASGTAAYAASSGTATGGNGGNGGDGYLIVAYIA